MSIYGSSTVTMRDLELFQNQRELIESDVIIRWYAPMCPSLLLRCRGDIMDDTSGQARGLLQSCASVQSVGLDDHQVMDPATVATDTNARSTLEP